MTILPSLFSFDLAPNTFDVRNSDVHDAPKPPLSPTETGQTSTVDAAHALHADVDQLGSMPPPSPVQVCADVAVK